MLRSNFLFGSAAFLANLSSSKAHLFAAATDSIANLEREAGARIGLSTLDSSGSIILGHRSRERFPLASTQKLPLVMTVLARPDLPLTRNVKIEKSELDADYSSISKHYPNGATLKLREICERTISQSDNTGADVLARIVGGPQAVTAYLRSINVNEIRIDRIERQLPDTSDIHEPRDTGTPWAMARLLWRLSYDSPLPTAANHELLRWMRDATTGNRRIRAGVPPGWHVADKTGSYTNAANDVGLIYPPQKSPVAIACYVHGVQTADDGSHVIAAVMKAIVPLI